MVLRIAFHIRCLPIRQEILDMSQIAVAFRGIRPPLFHPDLIAIAPQMALPWFCALLSAAIPLVSDLCGVDVQWFQVYSSQAFSNFLGVVSVNDFWFPRWLQELCVSFFLLPEKILFYMCMIVSTVLPRLALPQRIDDCCETHNFHRELCDRLLTNHQKFSARCMAEPVRFLRKELLRCRGHGNPQDQHVDVDLKHVVVWLMTKLSSYAWVDFIKAVDAVRGYFHTAVRLSCTNGILCRFPALKLEFTSDCLTC